MIVGIDLGTTHSLVGAYVDGAPKLFPNALGRTLTPSAISLDDDGNVIVGDAARDRLVTHPHVSVAAFKRWMGSAHPVHLGDRTFRPAAEALGGTVDEAVISVPAYFSDAQRKATRTAGELAGIRVERLINEPTAAALAYGLQERRDGGRFLVFDLGGGTFDVSVLEIFDGIVEVHASAGDNVLGGEDFLDVLVAACSADLGFDARSLAPAELGQLRLRLERLKRQLSNAATARTELRVDGRSTEWAVDEKRFERLAEPLVQRMRAPLERAMRDSRLGAADLDEIVLVGGASRMPLVARLVSRMFGRLPLRHVNPDEGIALGAAIAAGMKSRDARLEEVILTDVCPYTLGTEVSRRDDDGSYHNGFFHPIIQRNSTVPVSREDVFYPLQDNQTQLKIDVYQGESPMVDRNVKLGELNVPLGTRKPRDENSVNVRFTYDINGVLQVEATVAATGKTYEVVLQQNPGILDGQEIRARLARLAELKIHPRDKQENIAVLARAERLYEERLDDRPLLQQWIASFRAILDSQDVARIGKHRLEFDEGLRRLEDR
jgi:molecular chaperone HscC